VAVAYRIDNIVGDTFRISLWGPESGITCNQFLIADERLALIHTGRYTDYEHVRAAISEVLDPAKLEHVILLHFEADECGGMDRFLKAAPSSVLAGSWLSLGVDLSRWNYRGRCLSLAQEPSPPTGQGDLNGRGPRGAGKLKEECEPSGNRVLDWPR
jgi:hypothetical protein